MSAALSRRSSVTAAAGTAALAAAAASLAPAAHAEEAPAPNWLGNAPAISDADVTEIIDVDALVCGAGQAGTPAAYFAAEGGAKTL